MPWEELHTDPGKHTSLGRGPVLHQRRGGGVGLLTFPFLGAGETPSHPGQQVAVCVCVCVCERESQSKIVLVFH